MKLADRAEFQTDDVCGMYEVYVTTIELCLDSEFQLELDRGRGFTVRLS